MANENKDLKRIELTNETDASSTLITKQWAFAQDTDALVVKDSLSALHKYDSRATLAATTDGSAGADKIGVTGITGITPQGGSSGGNGTVQSMLEGFKTYSDGRYVTIATTQTITGAKTLSALITGTSGLTLSGGSGLDITGPSGAGQVVQMRGNTASGGYLTIYDQVNATARGYLGYGSTIIGSAAISDVGLRSQGALKFTSGGSTVRYEITAAGAHNFTGAADFSSTVNVAGDQENASGIRITRGTASAAAFQSKVTGDANNRFRSNADGELTWGNGTDAVDTVLKRGGASNLGITGSLDVSSTFKAEGLIEAVSGVTNDATASAAVFNAKTAGTYFQSQTAGGSTSIDLSGTSNKFLYSMILGDTGTEPDYMLDVRGTGAFNGAVTFRETGSTPSDPTSGTEGRVYIKGDNLIIQFNDAGTVRYKYLDLTGTGVTWVHTTTAP